MSGVLRDILRWLRYHIVHSFEAGTASSSSLTLDRADVHIRFTRACPCSDKRQSTTRRSSLSSSRVIILRSTKRSTTPVVVARDTPSPEASALMCVGPSRNSKRTTFICGVVRSRSSISLGTVGRSSLKIPSLSLRIRSICSVRRFSSFTGILTLYNA